jgi:hypothetical protein
LLFPIFYTLLGGRTSEFQCGTEVFSDRLMDLEELAWPHFERDEPHLMSPEIDEILELAGVAGPQSKRTRGALLEAMRKAAERRIACVTENKRRRYYGHAASLAATCVEVDPSSGTSAWMAKLRHEYRRYTALQRELSRWEK